MNSTLPRFEFRIFGTCLGMAEQYMRAIAAREAITESREVYLPGCDTGFDRNVKIREDKLEFKQFIEHYQGYSDGDRPASGIFRLWPKQSTAY